MRPSDFAHHQWILFDAAGVMVLTGVVGPLKNPEFGTAWDTIADAVNYVLTTKNDKIRV